MPHLYFTVFVFLVLSFSYSGRCQSVTGDRITASAAAHESPSAMIEDSSFTQKEDPSSVHGQQSEDKESENGEIINSESAAKELLSVQKNDAAETVQAVTKETHPETDGEKDVRESESGVQDGTPVNNDKTVDWEISPSGRNDMVDDKPGQKNAKDVQSIDREIYPAAPNGVINGETPPNLVDGIPDEKAATQTMKDENFPRSLSEGLRGIDRSDAEKEKKSIPPQCNFFTVSAGSGLFIPVSRYADRYDPALSFSADADLFLFSLRGFNPVCGLSFAEMKSRSDPLLVRATMDIFSATAGVEKPFFFLSGDLRCGLSLYGGYSRISFTSDNEPNPVVDFVGTAGARAAVSYNVWRGIEAGIGLSVQRIFTAGVPLDSVGVTVSVGGRF